MQGPAFSRLAGTLHAEGVCVAKLAEAVGTPAYVYSVATLTQQYRRLSDVLRGTPHRIHYAAKANGALGILAHLRSLGACVDVVSGGELYRARRAGFASGQIIFGGVGKSEREIGEAVDARVALITIESDAELDLVHAMARQRNARQRVGIRVNPEVQVESFHDYIKTGQKGDKFGVPYDQAAALAVRAAALPNVELAALGMHLGSQLSQLSTYEAGLARLGALVQQVRGAGVTTLTHVDIGGGLPVAYNDDEPKADLPAYAQIVIPFAKSLGLELIVEPGRFLVAEAGILLTRVLYTKRSGGRNIVVADAGMSDLLRPSHYDAYHEVLPVAMRAGARASVDLVGPICESGDFIALGRELAPVVAGDLLCVCTAGAYGSSMASNYNARPRAVEVLVSGDQYAIISQRESYEDLVQREVATPPWSAV